MSALRYPRCGLNWAARPRAAGTGRHGSHEIISAVAPCRCASAMYGSSYSRRENAWNLATSCGRAPTARDQSSRCQGSTATPNRWPEADASASAGCDSWGPPATISAGTVRTASSTTVALRVSRLSNRRLMQHLCGEGRRARRPALMQHRREPRQPDRHHDERQLEHEQRQPHDVARRTPQVRDLPDAEAGEHSQVPEWHLQLQWQPRLATVPG